LQNGIIAGQTTKEWFLGEVIKVKEKKKRKNENHELKKLLKKVLTQKKPSPIDPLGR